MSAEAAVAEAQARYVREFKTFATRQISLCTRGASEVKLRIDGSTAFFDMYYCADFIRNDSDPEAIELAATPPPRTSAISEMVRGIRLVIEYVRWDDIEIEHDAPDISTNALSAWFEYWFDPDDRRHDPKAETSGVIHSLIVSPTRLQVDFGTAESSAFWTLLDLLKHAGAATIWVRASGDLALRQS
jgi:hypothetical protein